MKVLLHLACCSCIFCKINETPMIPSPTSVLVSDGLWYLRLYIYKHQEFQTFGTRAMHHEIITKEKWATSEQKHCLGCLYLELVRTFPLYNNLIMHCTCTKSLAGTLAAWIHWISIPNRNIERGRGNYTWEFMAAQFNTHAIAGLQDLRRALFLSRT